MSGEWSYIKNINLINILINNSYGYVFLKSIEASDWAKYKKFLFEVLDGVVHDIREHLVVQVATDNAITSCATYCIDLIFEKLGELPQHKNAPTKVQKKVNLYITILWTYEKVLKERNIKRMLEARQPLEVMFTSNTVVELCLEKKT
ncbi:hypothetical protein M5K25_015065 [Dendrobium thyrsiflorum]|uniref:DUF659 domain-containing protein n=1 Tax=Dendrobium thyrsiflorum TaxID=117978 RepID=A0ABD0UWL2_DENTH